MRLIDADLLESEVDEIRQAKADNYYFEAAAAVVQCIECIDEAPTIDAIPVEWLRERKHWAAIDGDPWAENITRYLLDAWQKEQEVKG